MLSAFTGRSSPGLAAMPRSAAGNPRPEAENGE
jgi:hypothetical protein